MTRWLEGLLRWGGMLLYWMHLHPLIIWLSRHRPKVLLYHACEATESDFIRDLGSNTTPAQLDAHLEFLVRHYRVVPLSALERGEPGDRAVVITFDDGYASVYANAFPRLKRRGLAATVYLTTDVVGNRAMIWINELNWLLRNRPTVARSLIAAAFDCEQESPIPSLLARACDRYDPQAVRGLLGEMRARAGLDAALFPRAARLYLTWEEITEMARTGWTFGNHTASHPNLARLSEAAQRQEMTRAQEALRLRPGAVSAFAYPFGLHDAASRRVAASVGFTSVMTVGGTNDSPAALDPVARVPVRARTTAALFAELEIVAPVKARVKRMLERLAIMVRPPARRPPEWPPATA